VIAHTAYPTEIPADLFAAVLTKPCALAMLLGTVAQHRRAGAGGALPNPLGLRREQRLR